MSQSRSTEYKVGLFTLAGLGAALIAIFALSPDLLKSRIMKPYHTILSDASGILPKTQVKTNGVNIGKVISVELTENATRVNFEVREDLAVPEGSTIEVRTVGFLGDKFLEIKRVENTKGNIPAQGLIPRNPVNVDLNEVISTVGDIAKDVKKITMTLKNVLGSDQGEAAMSQIVGNVAAVTEHARLLLQENREGVNQIVNHVEKLSHSLRLSLGDRERDLSKIVVNAREVSDSLKELLNSENRERLTSIIENFNASVAEINGASRNIRLISEKVEKGQGTIGKLVNEDKIVEDLQATVKELRDFISPANRLQTNIDYHGEYRRDESTQSYLNITFRTRPESYYLVGFTDLKAEEKLTRTTTEGNVRRESIERTPQLGINLQFGKRWYFTGLRFGLFENKGGLAGDLYLFDDRFKLSFEAFAFQAKNSTERRFAHLKTYASWLFFDHLYIMAGLDDPTRYRTGTTLVSKDLNSFFGAGLNFNDHDLKTLVGAASLSR